MAQRSTGTGTSLGRCRAPSRDSVAPAMNGGLRRSAPEELELDRESCIYASSTSKVDEEIDDR